MQGQRNAVSLRPWVLILIGLTLSALCAQSVQAMLGFDIKRFRMGHVMARGLVLTEEGNPTFVEYGETGEEVNEISEEVGPYVDAIVVSGERYRQIYKNYQRIKSDGEESYALGATVMTKDAYESFVFNTRDGERVTNKPDLQENTESVFVRNSNQLLIPDISPILYEAPIDLNDAQDVGEDTKSVLLSEQGRVLFKSENNIGYRVGFFEDEEEDPRLNPSESDRVYQGIPNVPIESVTGYVNGYGVTDDKGFFKTNFLISPCPGFYFDHTIMSYAKLRYKRFNPRGFRHGLFHLRHTSYEGCNGIGAGLASSGTLGGLMTYVNLVAMQATRPIYFYPTNFYVDSAFITGEGKLANPDPESENINGGSNEISVSTSEPTSYQYEAPDSDPTKQDNYDFDGDEDEDRTVLGDWEEMPVPDPATGTTNIEKRFVKSDSGPLQGVYFSSGDQNPDLNDPLDDLSQPDLVRLADKKVDFKHQGLLETISEDDLKETDLFVFRQSNGMLVTYREGLDDSEFRTRQDGGVNESKIFYQFLIRGPKTAASVLDPGFDAFQSEARMNPALHARKSDHLRSQEPIKIVAINRRTGYIGTVSATYMDFNINGLISFPIDELVMRPPNLKVKAERKYDIEAGMTKDEDDPEYLIGYEGAGTTNDIHVTITTEWFDHDGSPLPEELGDYGYTGRLAMVTGANSLGGQQAHFSIKPGVHLQQVRLRDGDYDTSEHFYVQIDGEPINGNPNFETLGAAADGPLQYRPKNYVPFLVPIEDEDSTIKQYNAYRKLKRDDSIPNDTVIDLGPVHKWFYRPEMQFSLYDLDMKNIFRVANEESGEAIDLYPQEKPTVVSTDDIIRIAYDLVKQQFEALPYLGPGQELVFAFGEEEIKAVLDENVNLVFTNIEHFSSLDPEDFLSIRLYSNNDPGNILWEYAFEFLDFYPVLDNERLQYTDGVYEVSADNIEVDLFAHLIGFANRDDEDKYEVFIKWNKTGSGSLAKVTDSDDDYAIFENRLTLPRTADSTAEVRANIADDDASMANTDPIKFKVVPGKASEITLNMEGSTYVGGSSQVNVTATVKDAWGNRLPDGTPYKLSLEGSLQTIGELPEMVNGQVNIGVRGTDFAESSLVKFEVGDVEQEVTVEVSPLEIQFVQLPTIAEAGKTITARVRATAGGSPAQGLDLDVWAEFGHVTQSTVVTDAAGEATITYIAPYAEGQASLKAMAAMQSPHVQTFSIQFSEPRPRLNTYRSKMVGDSSSDAAFSYTRWDGTNFNVNKAVQSTFDVSGENGETVNLSLGDAYSPNRLMLAAYWMNTLDDNQVRDEVGFTKPTAENVVIAAGTPSGGGNSFRFDSTMGVDGEAVQSRIKVAEASRIQLTNGVGFAIDILPDESGGTILNLGNALQLELLESGRLRLNAVTDSGTDYQLTSNQSLNNNQWYRVAGQVKDGQIYLQVDDEVLNTPISGLLSYSSISVSEIDGDGASTSESYDLIIGEAFQGQLNSLRWYNLTSGPLVTFENGLETRSVTIGPDNKETLVLNSTGDMKSFGSQLSMQNVTINSGDSKQTVTLLSGESFETIAARVINSGLHANAPSYDLSFLDNPHSQANPTSLLALNQSMLFPNAYAYDISFWDIASIVGTLIGLDSLGVIWDQVGNMLAGREVDMVAFTVAILDVLTLFPPAAPLKAIVTPVKLAVKLLRLGNNKAVKYLGGVMKKVYQKAKKRDFSLVYQGAAFFILIADAMGDAEAEEGLKFVASMINSTEDFISLLNYVSLADPEQVEETASNIVMNQDGMLLANSTNPLEHLFPDAHAAIRIPAGLGKLMFKNMKDLRLIVGNSAENFLRGLDEFAKVLKRVDGISPFRAPLSPAQKRRFLKFAFDKSMLTALAAIIKRVGVTGIPRLITSFQNQRIRPFALILIVSYIETEVMNDRLFPPSQSSIDRRHNLDELRVLYAQSISMTVQGGPVRDTQANGAAFHLMQLALFHATGQKIVGIEVPREVAIYKRDKDLEQNRPMANRSTRHVTEVDIVTGTRETGEEWWELKSKQAGPPDSMNYPKDDAVVWKFGTGGNAANPIKGSPIHKQLSLYRIALKKNAIIGEDERDEKGIDLPSTPNIIVSDINLNFHKFKSKIKKNSRKFTRNPSHQKINAFFKKEPSGNQRLIKAHINTSVKGSQYTSIGGIGALLDALESTLIEAVREDMDEMGFE